METITERMKKALSNRLAATWASSHENFLARRKQERFTVFTAVPEITEKPAKRKPRKKRAQKKKVSPVVPPKEVVAVVPIPPRPVGRPRTRPLPPPRPELTAKQKFSRYREAVLRYTRLTDKSRLPKIELREFNVWVLDHIISIYWGYQRGIPARVLADIENLQMLSAADNKAKNRRADWHLHPQGPQIKKLYPKPAKALRTQ